MGKKVEAFVFKYRKFFALAAYVIPIGLKIILHGTTPMPLLIAGCIVMILGMTLRAFSGGYLLGKHIVIEVGADYLCTSGPFGYIRNPLYAGNVMVGIGVSIALNEWYGYVFIILTYVLMYSVIIPCEEKFLDEKFGDAFLEYKKHVRRFLPRLRAYQGNAKATCSLKKGLWSEKYFILLMTVAFVAFYFLFVR